MTATVYATGAHVASVERHRLVGDRDETGVVSVAHAVSRPVVDGLAASVCGTLVTAIADMDWVGARAVYRCQECQRIAG
ncbi:hypothetical protein [Geodermatophilus sp. URMC 63]